ncbi:MAG TPA: amidohydrolase [Alphaproteobacteria bacterium]|nr:amidohydrolase [Alphaproteobacteria bacterium]HCO90633.1 amidohydrolase [Alphaproteobacteria bacterium]
MKVVDIHAHMVPKDFPTDPSGGKNPRWPCMQCNAQDASKATVMIADKPFRAIDDRCWDVDRRLEDMRAEGVDAQALSPMPELLSYWFDADDTIVMGRHIAEAIGGMIQKAPEHFYGLGMVPLQDPVRAAEELAVLKRDFGLHGVQIATNIMGKDLGDPHFTPFFAAAEELDMPVFVHGLQPVGQERWGANPMMGALAGYPLDSALAVASLINAQILNKFPKLRLSFSHGGGAAATVLNRMTQAWRSAPAMQKAMPQSPLEMARGFYYDTLVYEPALLRFLVELFGADRIFIGTDYPFPIRQVDPAAFLRDCGLAEGAMDAMMGGNALRFLGVNA